VTFSAALAAHRLSSARRASAISIASAYSTTRTRAPRFATRSLSAKPQTLLRGLLRLTAVWARTHLSG
jgi:hypothetical protein